MKRLGLLLAMALFVTLSSCKKEEYVYVDGMYTAEAADFHYGWKAYLKADIESDVLVSVEFDYLNEDGDLKTETSDEEYPMDPHPRVWCPELEAQLMQTNIVNFEAVDGVSGATGGSADANELFELALEAAETGDTSVQVAPAAE